MEERRTALMSTTVKAVTRDRNKPNFEKGIR